MISYENADVALNTGMILRAMLRHEPLARALLYSDKWVRTISAHSTDFRVLSCNVSCSNRFYNFIDYIEQTTFGIACDAQANFKVGFCHLYTVVDATDSDDVSDTGDPDST